MARCVVPEQLRRAHKRGRSGVLAERLQSIQVLADHSRRRSVIRTERIGQLTVDLVDGLGCSEEVSRQIGQQPVQVGEPFEHASIGSHLDLAATRQSITLGLQHRDLLIQPSKPNLRIRVRVHRTLASSVKHRCDGRLRQLRPLPHVSSIVVKASSACAVFTYTSASSLDVSRRSHWSRIHPRHTSRPDPAGNLESFGARARLRLLHPKMQHVRLDLRHVRTERSPKHRDHESRLLSGEEPHSGRLERAGGLAVHEQQCVTAWSLPNPGGMYCPVGARHAAHGFYEPMKRVSQRR